MILSEAEGHYDECLTPARATSWRCRRGRSTLADEVDVRTSADRRARYVDGRCAGPGASRGWRC